MKVEVTVIYTDVHSSSPVAEVTGLRSVVPEHADSTSGRELIQDRLVVC